MNEQQVIAWAQQFANEHGYMPTHDPQFQGQGGFSNQNQAQSLQHHLDAKQEGDALSQLLGRPLTEHDWRYLWFNGFTPENEGWPDWLGPKPTRPKREERRVPRSSYRGTAAYDPYIDR